MAGGAIGGAAIQGISTAIQTKLALDEAARNRNFQERMSNTAYQRGMKDLKLAGLNPILAGRFGGATTPTGGVGNLPGPTDVAGSARNVSATSLHEAQRKLMNQEWVNATANHDLITEQVLQARHMTTIQGNNAEISTARMRAELDKGDFDRTGPGRFLTKFEHGANRLLRPLSHIPTIIPYKTGMGPKGKKWGGRQPSPVRGTPGNWYPGR